MESSERHFLNHPSISINKYLDEIHEMGSLDTKIRLGAFYTYYYDVFASDSKRDFDIFRWFDKHPLIFVLGRGVNKQGEMYIQGINFHFMPIDLRLHWFDELDNAYNHTLTNKNQFIRMHPKLVLQLYKNAYYTIRNYIPTRIRSPYRLDTTVIRDVLELDPRSHVGTNRRELDQVFNRKPIPTNFNNINIRR